jgi:outer membrane receptor for ferrienterochelin and colicins
MRSLCLHWVVATFFALPLFLLADDAWAEPQEIETQKGKETSGEKSTENKGDETEQADQNDGTDEDVEDSTKQEDIPESSGHSDEPQTTAPESIVHQGTVTGHAGEPVPGAVVTFVDLALRLITDENGRFQVPAEPNSYLVRVEAPGMNPLEETIDLDEGTALGGFELFMELPMGDVVVSGTLTEKLLEAAPVRTQVVGREQIERRQSTNLAESLDATTGLRVEATCGNCNSTEIRLNGLEGRYTQILIDSNPVFSGLAGVYGLEQIPKEMIERVEIVKGGASAIYGAGAVGGIINVITTKPRKSFADVELRGSALGLSAPELRLGAHAGVVNEPGSMAFHVFGGAVMREPWDGNGDGFSQLGKVRQTMLGANTFIDTPGDGELQLKLHVIQERRRGGDSFNKPEHDAAIAESTNTRRYGGELRFSQLVSSLFNYNLNYAFAYTERDSYYGGGGDIELDTPPSPAGWDQKLAALGAYGTTKNPVHTGSAFMNFAYSALGDQIITLGGQFSADGLDDHFTGHDRVIEEIYWNLGGVAQHNWVLSRWAETVVGLRLDKHSALASPIASPRAALMLSPLEWLKTRTAFSMGFRAPQVFDEDLHVAIVGGEAQLVSNDPNLEAERSFSLAQQFEFRFDLGSNIALSTGLNGFWTRIVDGFTLIDNDDPMTSGQFEMLRINSGDTNVYGAELEAGLSFANKMGLQGGWTLQSSRNTDPHPDWNTKKILRTPGAYGFLEVWGNLLGALSISSVLDITGPMKVPHYAGYIPDDTLEESPWFFDWSANLSYRIDLSDGRLLTPFAGMRNILDSRQTDYDRGALRDAGYIYGPRLPRTLFVGIKGSI